MKDFMTAVARQDFEAHSTSEFLTGHSGELSERAPCNGFLAAVVPSLTTLIHGRLGPASNVQSTTVPKALSSGT